MRAVPARWRCTRGLQCLQQGMRTEGLAQTVGKAGGLQSSARVFSDIRAQRQRRAELPARAQIEQQLLTGAIG
jgi:hypothetical protein